MLVILFVSIFLIVFYNILTLLSNAISERYTKQARLEILVYTELQSEETNKIAAPYKKKATALAVDRSQKQVNNE